MREVQIKPLDWFVVWNGRRAETLIGPYEIAFDEPRYYASGPGGFSVNVASEGEAKAAAQSDYAARIRSALLPAALSGTADPGETFNPAHGSPATADQMAAVMLLHGNEQQQRQAISYAASPASDLTAENERLRAGIKRLSDEEEMCAETTGDDPFSLVYLAAKLAKTEGTIDQLRKAMDDAADVLRSIIIDCQGASVCGEPEMGLEAIYHKASDAVAALQTEGK